MQIFPCSINHPYFYTVISLRPIVNSDKERLAVLMNNQNVSMYMSNRVPFPYSEKDAESFLELIKNSPGHHFYAVTLNSELIGGAGLHPQSLNHSKNIELGYWLGEQYWNKGYTTEVVTKMIEKAFSLPDINKIFARTFEGNIASEKVLLKNGFILEGTLKQNIFKNGKYLDEKVFGLLRK